MTAKILVVDDQDEIRFLLKALLEISSYTVVCAEDGQKGYETALVENPDLILTDIGMPNVDGIKMISMIRKDSACRNVPVIVMTAYGNNAGSKAVKAGTDTAIDKPLQFNLLLELIKNLLPVLLPIASTCIANNLLN